MCLKKKPRAQPQDGHYLCKSCGAVARKKKKVCKPKKLTAAAARA